MSTLARKFVSKKSKKQVQTVRMTLNGKQRNNFMCKNITLILVLPLLCACDALNKPIGRPPVEVQPSEADIVGHWVGSINRLVRKINW